MALVEGIGCEFFPVGPYLLKHFGVMAVGLAAFKEFSFKVVHLVDEFLTHGFSECVAFASGEVGQQSRQKHHLFLIDCDAVGVLEVFFHLGDVILDWGPTMFSGDEIGYVVHRPRTIQGVHGDEVLEGGWL